jgi:uncharacterized protein YeaO (DUF488 family)
MAIAVKRVYEAPAASDGLRVLVDRLWPRGVSKVSAKIDLWPRSLSPSNELRTWYAHEAPKWREFKRRYGAELAAEPDAFADLSALARQRKVTLLFGSKEPRLNNAYALKEALEARERRRMPGAKRSSAPPARRRA